MKRGSQILLTLALAYALASLLRHGVYLRYVRPQMYPILLATVIGLTGLAAASLTAATLSSRVRATDHASTPGDNHDPHPGGHNHAGQARMGWLLLAPILVAIVVPPPALGAASAARAASLPLARDAAARPLPAGTPRLTLSEFAARARFGSSLTGRQVTLIGFSTPAAGGGWNLTRMVIWCCAADALVTQAHVVGIPDPGTDTWVEVTGTWQPGPSPVPVIDAAHVTHISSPTDPYE